MGEDSVVKEALDKKNYMRIIRVKKENNGF